MTGPLASTGPADAAGAPGDRPMRWWTRPVVRDGAAGALLAVLAIALIIVSTEGAPAFIYGGF